jgi:DtxR family Mn-dependent transcriptional regulator
VNIVDHEEHGEAQRPRQTATFENYVRAVYRLHEDHVEPLQVRLSERLGVPRRAVSENVARMREAGLLTDERELQLTPTGQELAVKVVRRHRVAELFLAVLLGLGWGEVSSEAGPWANVLSDEAEQAICRLLGNPSTCPHGNPIPGAAFEPTSSLPLNTLEPGQSGVLVRVDEATESRPDMLAYLHRAGMLPGASVRIVAKAPDGTIAVEVDGTTSVLASDIAEGVHVAATSGEDAEAATV